MIKLLALSTAVLVSGCASPIETAAPSSNHPDENGEITYYDRNHDGIVDYEFHSFGCCDRDWGLLDTDFNGRYDLKLRWGFSFSKEAVMSSQVPGGVTISKDAPRIPDL